MMTTKNLPQSTDAAQEHPEPVERAPGNRGGFVAVPNLLSMGMPRQLLPMYEAILRRDGKQGCWAAVATLAADCHKQERQAQRDIRALEQGGWITVQRRTAADVAKKRSQAHYGSATNLIRCLVRWEKGRILDLRTGGVMDVTPGGCHGCHPGGVMDVTPGGVMDDTQSRSRERDPEKNTPTTATTTDPATSPVPMDSAAAAAAVTFIGTVTPTGTAQETALVLHGGDRLSVYDRGPESYALGEPGSPAEARSVDARLHDVVLVLAMLNEARQRVRPTAPIIPTLYTTLGNIAKILAAGYTVEGCQRVIKSWEDECVEWSKSVGTRRERKDPFQWFNHETPFHLKLFSRRLVDEKRDDPYDALHDTEPDFGEDPQATALARLPQTSRLLRRTITGEWTTEGGLTKAEADARDWARIRKIRETT